MDIATLAAFGTFPLRHTLPISEPRGSSLVFLLNMTQRGGGGGMVSYSRAPNSEETCFVGVVLSVVLLCPLFVARVFCEFCVSWPLFFSSSDDKGFRVLEVDING